MFQRKYDIPLSKDEGQHQPVFVFFNSNSPGKQCW